MSDPIELPASAVADYRRSRTSVEQSLRAGRFSPVRYDTVLAARIGSALDVLNARLVATPDDDPRWGTAFAGLWYETPRGPVRRSAEYIVLDRLDEILAADPGDGGARWALIAEDLLLCQNEFAGAHLMELARRDVTDVRWLIAAAIWVHALSGVPTSRLLLLHLEALALERFKAGATPPLWQVLRDLAGAEDPHTRWAAGIGYDLLVVTQYKYPSLAPPG